MSDIKYVGVNDHEIDLFEGQYIVPNGMSYNSYTINPAKADIPISPIGEIPFFRTLLEPKYRVPRTIVIITAVVSTDNAPELPTMC